MRVRSTSWRWLCLTRIIFLIGWATPTIARSSGVVAASAITLPRTKSRIMDRLESIPRGGGISLPSVPIAIDPKTVATTGLSCIALYCALDILVPKRMVQLYGLDPDEEINSFYMSRVGGWGMAVATSLFLQLYTNVPVIKTIGYAFLPISLITMVQLLTGKYEQAGVNPNSGIAAVVFQDIHFVSCFLATRLPTKVIQIWIPFYMAMIGLSGLNLVISSQTVPGISSSTITILRILGSVSCYLATTILVQQDTFLFDAASPLKAAGIGLVVLVVTSIPVCLDLYHHHHHHRVNKTRKGSSIFELVHNKLS